MTALTSHRPVVLLGALHLSQRQHTILNAVAFQLGWWACVLGGSWLAMAEMPAVVAVHLNAVPDKRTEFLFLMQCTALGFICDMALISAGVLETGYFLPPLWLTSLWILFGTTVGYALRFFHDRLALCIAGGAVFAPTSYFGGARLADVTLLEPIWLALLIISLMWAMMFPLLIRLHALNKKRFSKKALTH